MEDNKTGYILFYDFDEYVESYDLGDKSVTTSPVRRDAEVFQSKGKAEYVAEVLGCKIKNI